MLLAWSLLPQVSCWCSCCCLRLRPSCYRTDASPPTYFAGICDCPAGMLKVLVGGSLTCELPITEVCCHDIFPSIQLLCLAVLILNLHTQLSHTLQCAPGWVTTSQAGHCCPEGFEYDTAVGDCALPKSEVREEGCQTTCKNTMACSRVPS